MAMFDMVVRELLGTRESTQTLYGQNLSRNPSGHGRLREKSWTPAQKRAFSCGLGGGDKHFDPWASGRKGLECPQEIRTKKFMFMFFFFPELWVRRDLIRVASGCLSEEDNYSSGPKLSATKIPWSLAQVFLTEEKGGADGGGALPTHTFSALAKLQSKERRTCSCRDACHQCKTQEKHALFFFRSIFCLQQDDYIFNA